MPRSALHLLCICIHLQRGKWGKSLSNALKDPNPCFSPSCTPCSAEPRPGALAVYIPSCALPRHQGHHDFHKSRPWPVSSNNTAATPFLSLHRLACLPNHNHSNITHSSDLFRTETEQFYLSNHYSHSLLIPSFSDKVSVSWPEFPLLLPDQSKALPHTPAARRMR